jgi:GNAT superfamily N-acetyltransferase
LTRPAAAAGYGTRLLGRVLEHLGADGISVVEAKTLDRSSGYRPYEATRAFWERNGFVHVDTIDPLPGWEPGNPAYKMPLGCPVTRESRST